jgi:hypothetical protein
VFNGLTAKRSTAERKDGEAKRSTSHESSR